MTLEDLKRLYREYYVKVLEKEQNRGFTTHFEKNKLEWFRKQIAFVESDFRKSVDTKVADEYKEIYVFGESTTEYQGPEDSFLNPKNR